MPSSFDGFLRVGIAVGGFTAKAQNKSGRRPEMASESESDSDEYASEVFGAHRLEDVELTVVHEGVHGGVEHWQTLRELTQGVNGGSVRIDDMYRSLATQQGQFYSPASLLMYACGYAHASREVCVETVRTLIERGGADVNATNADGDMTVLGCACTLFPFFYDVFHSSGYGEDESGDFELREVRCLVDRHDKANACISLLLENGADPNRKFTGKTETIRYQESPLAVCARRGNAVGVSMLLKYGAEIDTWGLAYDPEHNVSGITDCLEERTVLFIAMADAPHFETIKTLLLHGADLDTALHACFAVRPDGTRERMAIADDPYFTEYHSHFTYANFPGFLAGVLAAGSYRSYLKEPRVELVRLRLLCARGRATPPADPVLQRLFGAPGASTKRAPMRAAPLPNEVVWHIFSFWRSGRDGRAESRCPDVPQLSDSEIYDAQLRATNRMELTRQRIAEKEALLMRTEIAPENTQQMADLAKALGMEYQCLARHQQALEDVEHTGLSVVPTLKSVDRKSVV